MLLVLGRVERAELKTQNFLCQIAKGLVVFVGIEKGDERVNLAKTAEKILNLKVFEDEEKKLKLSLLEVKGEILLVPNFTLAAGVSGRRLEFDNVMPASAARNIYQNLLKILQAKAKCCGGKFGAFMEIEAVYLGPVNVVIKILS